jgi:subtilisin-like proprotein convertase family protein
MGRNENVLVQLDRDIVDGETLYAMLHIDAGILGVYEFPGADGPARDGAGNVIAPAFRVVAPLALTEMALGIAIPDDDDAGITAMIGVPVDCTIDDLAVQVAIDHTFQGDLVVSIAHGGTSVTLYNQDGLGGPLSEVWPVTDEPSQGADALHMFHAANARGVWTLSVSDRAAFDEGTLEVFGLFFECAGGRPELPDTIPSVTAADQTLDDLSTIVMVPEAVSDGPGFMVIHEDNGTGGIGGVIGHAALTDGVNTNVEVELERPATNGETLYAMLHRDAGTIGTYEFPGADGPVTDLVTGAVITPGFDVTVPAGTPAVRFTIDANDTSTAFEWVAVEPSVAIDLIAGGLGSEDANVTLAAGWRYEVVNTVSSVHPLELLTLGADPNDSSMDTILLSQGGGVGSLEGDASVEWLDSGSGTIRFTVSPSLAAALDGYRCFVHRTMMRGTISILD